MALGLAAVPRWCRLLNDLLFICRRCPHIEQPPWSGDVKCTVNGRSVFDNAKSAQCPKGYFPPNAKSLPTKLTPTLTLDQLAAAEAHAAVCEKCNESTAEGRAGVSRKTWTVTCRLCGCGGLSLVDGDCQMGKWQRIEATLWPHEAVER